MKGWIFNASPLILLGKINQLHLIEVLSPSFRIPTAVVTEIGAGPANDPTIQWLSSSSIADHFVESPQTPSFLTQWDLGAGETSVLSLALSDSNSPVILDDLAARKFAMTYEIPLLGTLGLLIRAKHLGIIDQVTPHVNRLEEVGANLSPSLITHALKLAGETT
jgi:predicted nucleic acid-binding protein